MTGASGRTWLRLDASVTEARVWIVVVVGEVVHQNIVQHSRLQAFYWRQEGSMKTVVVVSCLRSYFLISKGRNIELCRDLGQDILVILQNIAG